MNIEWKKIDGFEQYMVNRNGLVRIGNRVLKTHIRKGGYIGVNLYSNGKRIHKPIHRLVAIAFIKRENGKNYVNHKDGIKANNNISNLEWCTHKENINHAYNSGLLMCPQFYKNKNK